MQILLLGRVTVVDGDRVTTLRSARQSALLAALALQSGHGVPGSGLARAVFGEDQPATARNTLQVHASALRRVLGAETVRSHGDGYLLDDRTTTVDALDFTALVEDGLISQHAGRHEEAARRLRSALATWRGVPFEGLDSPGLEPHRHRLEALRLTARLARVDAELALGRHLFLVPELTELLQDHPYDETVADRLLVALYRSGRQVEALATYRQVRDRLAHELGVEPGPRLRRTHEEVLRQGPLLEAPTASRIATVPAPPDPGAPVGGTVDLVGREALLAELQGRLCRASVTTLVGPSGVGKTRIALAAAARMQHRFPDGTVLVPAGDLGSVEDLEVRVRQVVAAQRPGAVLPGSDRPAVDRIRALVVLDDLRPVDGVEHWIGDLPRRGRATWLLTSSRPLDAPGEQVVQVPSLPAWDADGAPGPAAVLLVDRAATAGAPRATDRATMRLAAECADLLDGNPLALELAAPSAVLGLRELRDHLARRGRADLMVTFASSLDRLQPAELLLLDVLTCAGGPLDATTLLSTGVPDAVGTLSRLVRDGMVVRVAGSPGANLYSVRPLLADHRASTRDPAATRTAQHRLLDALVTAVGPRGPWTPMQMADAEHARRLVAMEPALAAAPDLARELGRGPDVAEVAMVLSELHYSRYAAGPRPGRFTWLLLDRDLPPPRRVDLLLAEGVDLVNHDEPARGRARLEQALAEARTLDDPGRAAIALGNLVVSRVITGRDFGTRPEDWSEAIRLAEQSGSDEVLAGTLLLLYPTPGSPPALRGSLARAVGVARAARHEGLLALASHNLAAWLLENGDLENARVHALESAAAAERLHNRAILVTQRAVLGTVEVLSGSDAGLRQVTEVLRVAWEHDELRTSADALLRLAAGSLARGRATTAARCLGTYRALLSRAGAVPSETEDNFLRQWLAGVVPRWPRRSVADAVAELIAATEA
ncbi:BTAD domain-containing putative transcriptional regulator [Nocardioides sp. CFH 31398]|uniref:AfsR/SARP family transcriptional regulator n=1 Tax=Nocardioides sp. CFH 31398 TaxID=2919579 RepID=UPI001F06B452|nr:BTAD domain-containing putative transcriptional regulator [Nocardioides sp. CFH 31398]MCH1865626.1 winged helix-turn-helix domain-containing protein [Nocardioides sp. CFH 31398]